MASRTNSKSSEVLERQSPPDQLPPPSNSIKPLTPFGIDDILRKPPVRRSYSVTGASHYICVGERQLCAGHSHSGRAVRSQSSPLCALEELTSKTFKGLEVSVLQAAEGRDGLAFFGQRSTPKKRRKSRTAFTNHQIYELEKRFLYQKYLSPADRDQIAQQLALTNAQVITWFQNRRAKLKRDLEEMKADVESAKAAGSVTLEKLSKLRELEESVGPGLAESERDPIISISITDIQGNVDSSKPLTAPPSQESLEYTNGLNNKCCSEGEEEEIDVGD
ncbi:uncharacterized protein V6R79_020500 [Siganus canaliculatus]